MNNSNVLRIKNENGMVVEYGEIHDLWHVAQAVGNGQNFSQMDPHIREKHCKQILAIWHMAHDLKAVLEGQGEAQLLTGGAEKPSHWIGQEGHPVSEWQQECWADDTRLGYLDWCDARREQAES